MSSGRSIVWSHNCDAAAEQLGGYGRIDDALIPVIDALQRNPYGTRRVDIDWCSTRFITTDAFKDVPALVRLFYIEPNGTVVIDHVEALDDY
jgi:hypothetical protein